MDNIQALMDAIHQMDAKDNRINQLLNIIERLVDCAELNQESLEPETIELLEEVAAIAAEMIQEQDHA